MLTEEMNGNMENPKLEKPSLFGMIMNPSVQFNRIKENPKILIAFIIVTILGAAGITMMMNSVDIMNDPNMQGFSEEEMMYATWFTQITAIVTGIFTPVFTILISTIVYFFVAKIAHSEVTFKKLFSMNTYIFLISALSFILNGLAFMLAGNFDATTFTSINSIIGAEGAMGAFLNTIEVFTIWSFIITALGLQIVGKFSKGLSWGVVIGIYVITTGMSMVTAGFTSMLGV